MKPSIRIYRLLALLLAVYAAAGMCRAAAALAEEDRRAGALALALSETEAEIALKRYGSIIRYFSGRVRRTMSALAMILLPCFCVSDLRCQ